jgi:hypothetical protein
MLTEEQNYFLLTLPQILKIAHLIEFKNMKSLSVNKPHIVHEIFSDQEAAIINLKTGTYYSLNPTGAEIWSFIEKNSTNDEIISEFNRCYDVEMVDVANIINDFIKNLETEDLIVARENHSENSAETEIVADNKIKKRFVEPTIERFADMQELLLLDPIHDVDEAGFPHKKAD